MNLYEIPQDHIFSSRDTTFAKGIRRMTNGKGIDVVLNSLAGEELAASWELIEKYGRSIEIGIKDIEAHNSLPMFPFAQNVSFSAIDISAMSRERLLVVQKALQSWMYLYTKGGLHPAQPLKCYTASNVEDAFRSIQSGKNMGKMVMELNDKDSAMTMLKTKPTTRFRSNATYVICGGFGGLGRSISRWMANQGAKNLILLSRSGAHSAEAINLIEELESKGVSVQAPACNVADLEDLISVLNKVTQSMPPIRGCIQAAMVLKDSIFANMSYESWKAAISSKVQGSWNLHSQLQDLDFFILLSSITGVLGAAEQANYAAGNTYLDALARYRISKGQPAVSIDLGVRKGEGFLAEHKDLLKRCSGPGYFIDVPQEQLFAMLDYYCDPSLPLPTEFKSQAIIGIDIPAKLRSRRIEIPYWMRRPLLRQLHQIESVQYNSVAAQESAINYSSLLFEAESLNEAGLVVAQLLRRKHSLAFAIPEEQIHVQDSMVAHGVDSLVLWS
ncbi:hypothetical protein MFRU_003g04360 [Monilinia fructicola]|nr:hypothetical protein MFRU_003g04360 [Monilinia fructicola]